MPNAPELSPPWIIYFNQLKYSIGADPLVTVGPLIPVQDQYLALVMVDDYDKAQALATLLTPSQNFGNVTLTVVVIYNQEIVSPIPCRLDAFEVAHLVNAALEGNTYFQEVVVQRPFPGGMNAVYPIFAADVIQFYADDVSNLCNTFTGVASQVFQEVMVDTLCRVQILYSTSCSEQTDDK
ncbi:hypothetical protein LCL96_01505 [Rossellomorea aquimaris]|uniref:hypothetical protein n=1 Tax=Rossellomorea aquimaris TaxID=189382 RepID=UPI001CD4BBCE|nr:hypothetical protein [Rossellomorea aquimaris]MCA1057591.1 hypothetical protein [Rossellomorea aquimaris]